MANYDKNIGLVKEHLQQGEEIKSSIFGAYECKLLGNDSVRNGIFVATDRRIVFFAKKLIGYDLETFPFENISSIEKSKSMLGHTVTFFYSGNKASMKWIKKDNVDEFTNYVTSMIGKKNNGNSSQNIVIDDIPTQIKKLSELMIQGILTSEEFDKKKAELLSRM